MKKIGIVLLHGVGLFLLLYLMWTTVGERRDYCVDATAEDPTPSMVALTFDDGPHIYTERLLDGLAKRGIKATFFLIGRNVEGRESTVERMVREGHLIGNHTYSHVQLTAVSDHEACQEIDQTNAVLTAAGGTVIHYIRPPFGLWQTGLDSLVDMEVVLWTVDPEDWRIQDTGRIVQRVLREVGDGDIILLHDVYKTSVEAAFQIIDALQEKGYEFVRVDELLLD